MSACNIFIVDDDKDDHQFIRAAIQQVLPQAKVRSYFDGVELPESWFREQEIPNLIILDLNMQIVDGKTALARIRKDETVKHVPVIILSTSADPQDKFQCLNLGANDYFIKPYTETDMAKVVSRLKNRWLDGYVFNS